MGRKANGAYAHWLWRPYAHWLRGRTPCAPPRCGALTPNGYGIPLACKARRRTYILIFNGPRV